MATQDSDKKADKKDDKNSPSKDVLHIALADCEQLMFYAFQQGLPIPDEILKSIISTKAQNDLSQLAEDKILQFWKSANALTKLVQPVSVDSIKNISELEKTTYGYVIPTGWYNYIGAGLLIILVVLQIYWVWGTDLTTTIDRVTAENSRLQTELNAAKFVLYGPQNSSPLPANGAATDSTAQQSSPPANATVGSTSDLMKTIDNNERLIAQNNAQINAEQILLGNWMTVNPLAYRGTTPTLLRQYFLTPEEIKEQDAVIEQEKNSKNAIYLNSAKLTLKAMVAYLLPFLYGSLGAVAYILRTISREIVGFTLSTASSIRFQLRMVLGMLSGITVGLILTPETIPSSLASVTPLAMAFLAGYSVELLFSAMDRLIAAFSTGLPQANGK